LDNRQIKVDRKRAGVLHVKLERFKFGKKLKANCHACGIGGSLQAKGARGLGMP